VACLKYAYFQANKLDRVNRQISDWHLLPMVQFGTLLLLGPRPVFIWSTFGNNKGLMVVEAAKENAPLRQEELGDAIQKLSAH
jgi:hypothetical protein